MYKKCGRHDKDAESTNNDEEQFATYFFNFMRKHSDTVISQASISQVNLDIGTAFTPNSVPITKSNLWITSRKTPLAHYSMTKAEH
jgi:hypothetical protein